MRKYIVLSVVFFMIFLSCSLEKIDPRSTFLVVLESERNERAKKVIFDREQFHVLGETTLNSTSNMPFTLVVDKVGRKITNYETLQEVRENFTEVDMFDFVKGGDQFFMGGTRRPSEFNDEDRIIICTEESGNPSNWKREGFGQFNAGFQAFLGLNFFENDRLLAAGFDAGAAVDGRSGLASVTEFKSNCDDPIPVKEFQKAVRSTLEGDIGQYIIRSENTGNFLLLGIADLGKDIFIIELDNDLNFLSEVSLFPANQRVERYNLAGMTQTEDGRLLLLVWEQFDSGIADTKLSIFEFTDINSPPKEHLVNVNGLGIEGQELLVTDDGYLVLGNVFRYESEKGIKRGYVAYLDKNFQKSKEPEILPDTEDFIFSSGTRIPNEGFVFCGTTKNAGLDKIFLIKADAEGEWEE